jgi:hypothetical protein
LDSVAVDARSIFEMLQDQSTQQQADIVKSYKLLQQKSQSSARLCQLSQVLNEERCGPRKKGF